VIVDDYFPVNQRGEPIFAKPSGNREIWVMILEKCWAKLNGSYADIEGGLPY
jgi:calpain-15